MKKRLLLTLAVVAVVTALVATLSCLGPERPVALTFIEFTNTTQGTEALFWFSNRVDTDIWFGWNIRVLRRSSPSGWVEVGDRASPAYKLPTPSLYTPTNLDSKPAPNFTDLDLIGIPIPTTNAPIQVVLDYRQTEKLGRRWQIWWAEFRANLGNTNRFHYDRCAYYSLTAQTVVGQSPPNFRQR